MAFALPLESWLHNDAPRQPTGSRHRGKFEPGNWIGGHVRFIIFSALVLICQVAAAETVQVKITAPFHLMPSRVRPSRRAVTFRAFATTRQSGTWLFSSRRPTTTTATSTLRQCKACRWPARSGSSSKRAFAEVVRTDHSTAGRTLSRRSIGSNFLAFKIRPRTVIHEAAPRRESRRSSRPTRYSSTSDSPADRPTRRKLAWDF